MNYILELLKKKKKRKLVNYSLESIISKSFNTHLETAYYPPLICHNAKVTICILHVWRLFFVFNEDLMLASLTLSWLLWLCGRPDSELRSCSSLERKSHFQTEQWKVCQGQETGQYLYNKHNALVILQRLCNFDTYIFDTSHYSDCGQLNLKRIY